MTSEDKLLKQRKACKRWRDKNKVREVARNRAWNLANPDKVRCAHFRARYGITFAGAKALLAEQGGACKICARPLTYEGTKGRDLPVLDHDHSTKKLRGVLCTPCNLMLGYAKDSPAVLRIAANYLEPL